METCPVEDIAFSLNAMSAHHVCPNSPYTQELSRAFIQNRSGIFLTSLGCLCVVSILMLAKQLNRFRTASLLALSFVWINVLMINKNLVSIQGLAAAWLVICLALRLNEYLGFRRQFIEGAPPEAPYASRFGGTSSAIVAF